MKAKPYPCIWSGSNAIRFAFHGMSVHCSARMTTKPVSNDLLLQQLRWRYATKKFDSTRRISAPDWETLEQALILTPSSFGLQPWKFIVVTDQAMKEKLVPASWNQRQLADCSHVVIFAIKKHVGTKEIDGFLRRVVQVRGVTLESLAAYRDLMLSHLVEGPESIHVNLWALRQVYIALGNFMTSAAMLGIDTCPIEGFEPAKYDKLLGLAKRDLAASVVCVAGYRAADDKYASLPKVRFNQEDVIERI